LYAGKLSPEPPVVLKELYKVSHVSNSSVDQIRERGDSLVQILRQRAEATPDQTAYGSLDGELNLTTISYGELDDRVRRHAKQLRAVGLCKNDGCLLLFPQGIEFIVSLLACNLIGAVPVPLNMPVRNKPLLKWENIANDCRAVCAIADQADLAALRSIFEKSAILSSRALYSEQTELVASESAAPEPDLHELAYLQYTSGSTGHPKGVMISHSSLLQNLKHLESRHKPGNGRSWNGYADIFQDQRSPRNGSH
jgi:acyl-CoA synthetase (AMP-forming)/AMP-acid ligase II